MHQICTCNICLQGFASSNINTNELCFHRSQDSNIMSTVFFISLHDKLICNMDGIVKSRQSIGTARNTRPKDLVTFPVLLLITSSLSTSFAFLLLSCLPLRFAAPHSSRGLGHLLWFHRCELLTLAFYRLPFLTRSCCRKNAAVCMHLTPAPSSRGCCRHFLSLLPFF